MPTQSNFSDDFEARWSAKNAGMIGGFCLVLGLAIGVGITQYSIHQEMQAEIAAMRKEIKATHDPLNQLTGFKEVTDRSNTLLSRLEDQSRKLYKAGQTIERSNRLCKDIDALALKLSGAQWSAAEISGLEAEMKQQREGLDRAQLRLASNQRRVDELEAMIDRLTRDMPKTREAQASLLAIDRLRDDIINQQCMIPELSATVDSHRLLEASIRKLAENSDTTQRAIDALASNQDQIHNLAIESEHAAMVLLNVESLLEDQQAIDVQVENLAVSLDKAADLAHNTSRLNVEIQDVRKKSAAASATLDQLAWMCEYLSAQDHKLVKAEQSLKQIDSITGQVNRLDDTVPTLVEHVELIEGLNKTLGSVLTSSQSIRAKLAEIVLMQPVVEQLASSFRTLTTTSPQTELVDSKERAKQLIEAYSESTEAVFVSQAK